MQFPKLENYNQLEKFFLLFPSPLVTCVAIFIKLCRDQKPVFSAIDYKFSERIKTRQFLQRVATGGGSSQLASHRVDTKLENQFEFYTDREQSVYVAGDPDETKNKKNGNMF